MNSFPDSKAYTIEPHGDGHAIYCGRDGLHHGMNLGHITEASPETLKLLEDALNAVGREQDATSEPRVHLELTLEQAAALVEAADLFSRVGIGQLEALAMLVRDNTIPMFAGGVGERTHAGPEVCRQVEDVLMSAKDVMGFPRNGSRGIGHKHNDVSVTRAYEVKKVLDKALAVHRNPNPRFRGVNYDGLIVRYTQEPAPDAVVRGGRK